MAGHDPVHCAFVFDTEILGRLRNPADRRLTFIWDSVAQLREALQGAGGGLHVLHGEARRVIPALARSLGVEAVYANRDYEPEAVARDDAVAAALREAGIRWRDCKDQVVFELDEVRTRHGDPFSVFTPYRKAWLAKLVAAHTVAKSPGSSPGRLASATGTMPSLKAIGFSRQELPIAPGMSGAARVWTAFKSRLDSYAVRRDFPALDGTSRLSVHLRFGTLSIRELVRHAAAQEGAGAASWLSELIWREFYFAVLAARPDVVDHCYRREFDALQWDEHPAHWKAWCEGRTGYPMVDAAMRELVAQGTMHNRLRMVAASFLTKDLGIDWRRGERYFAEHLLDYDLAANNGGWQWSASTGCDGQPWFRIFNPIVQSRRFDPAGDYIRRWIPELLRVPDKHVHAPWELSPVEQRAAGCAIGRDYPAPIVSHEAARRRTLARFRAVKSGAACN